MLKKVLKTTLFLFAVITLFGCQIQKPEERVKTITVSGNGSVSLKADLVSMHFVIKTSEWNFPFASDKNLAATTKVIEALKALGIGEDDISSFDYKVTQDNSNSYPGKYSIINTISVLIRNTDNIPKVIDTAIANGANGLTDFTYLVSDKSTALRQARTMAVQNAQDAANLLAGASGCRVDQVLDIKENESNVSTYSLKGFNETFTGIKQLPSEEGNFTVNSSVTITYSLAN